MDVKGTCCGNHSIYIDHYALDLKLTQCYMSIIVLKKPGWENEQAKLKKKKKQIELSE